MKSTNQSSLLFAFIIKIFFYAILLSGISACNGEPNVARGLAAELARQARLIICPAGSQGGTPCGSKDVRAEANWGTTAYINIYGVTNQEEIKLLTDFVTTFRDTRDKRIPVELTFYSTLDESEKIKRIQLKGE